METLNFSIKYEQFLAPDGSLLKAIPSNINDPKTVVEAYKTMMLIRAFDQKAIALQRTGKLGTYPSVLGQEAIGTAIGQAMSKNDVFAPYYRDLSTQYLRGVSLKEMLLYWGGSERGSAYENCPNDFPNCVPIATQYGHAAGAAVAMKTKGLHHASLVTCGEGATSKGDFLETLNLAGAWQLPLVMVVDNNHWAISTPRSIQCGAQTIAQKAIGAGIEGVVVDGNDYFAVLNAVTCALEKAYSGKGATLIEAMSYRLGDHTTADDASRYRDAQELEQAWLREPIVRLRQFMFNKRIWSEDKEKVLQESIAKQINRAVESYLSAPPETPESMFDHLYETLPKPLEDQYAQVSAISALNRSELGRFTLDTNQSNTEGGAKHESAF